MRTINKHTPPANFTIYANKINSTIHSTTLSGGELWDKIQRNLKQNLRESLAIEQGYICCYCGRNIVKDTKGKINLMPTSIEHFLPKSIYREKTFDYTNLLLSCNGKGDYINLITKENETIENISKLKNIKIKTLKKNNPHLNKYNNSEILPKGISLKIRINRTCDEAKNNKEINLNPTDKLNLCEDILIYESSGEIKTKTEYSKDINILNLNSDELKNSRKEKWKAIEKQYNDLVTYFRIQKIDPKSLINNLESFIKKLLQDIDNKISNNESIEEFIFVKIFYFKEQFKRMSNNQQNDIDSVL
jgi:uncharacterized protein (TIGR02646 family)